MQHRERRILYYECFVYYYRHSDILGLHQTRRKEIAGSSSKSVEIGCWRDLMICRGDDLEKNDFLKKYCRLYILSFSSVRNRKVMSFSENLTIPSQ